MMPVVDQVEPTDLEANVIEYEVLNENDSTMYEIGDMENFDVKSKNVKKKGDKNKPRRPPALNEIANNILEAFDKSIKPNENIAASIEKLAETYKVIETEKLQIEKRKLNFEIQKYKFEHPNFNMND